ncbi:MAG: TIGR00341 family protein [Candidatus Peribacteraceae bacterium]|nr:TIGR00341 family protein [Candidatus Peribacteraceae bacterium]
MIFSYFANRHESLLEVTRKEQREAIESLIEQGSMRNGYYLLLTVAALIVTPGLLLDNVAVVIGGMILAPLMIPLLSISLSLVSGSLNGLLRSLRILVISVLLTIIVSATVATVVSHSYNDVVTWIPEEISPGVYIFIAFCSGVAGAFAWVKKSLSASTAGVAIAVSLLPPLCATGIGIAQTHFLLVRNGLVLFGANFVGICMGGFIVFWLLGFLDSGKTEEKVIEKEKQG